LTRSLPPLWFYLLVMALFAALASPAQAAPTGSVTGRLTGDADQGSMAGKTVVLLQMRIGPQGQPQPVGPPDRTQTGPDGGFVFENVQIQVGTVFQVGSRTRGGELTATRPFTFPPRGGRITMNLHLAERKAPVDAESPPVWFQRVIVAVEARSGQAAVTEVIHLVNNTGKLAFGPEHPLRIPIAPGTDTLEPAEGLDESNLRKEGQEAVITRYMPAGRTVMIFAYITNTPLGSLNLDRRYPYPVEDFAIYSPAQDKLIIDGTGLLPRAPENIQNTLFQVWGRANILADTEISASVQGLQPSQWMFGLPALLFLLVMGGLVFRYLRQTK